jgi:uncharacterized membrane protein
MSSEIFAVERGLQFTPMIISAPIINIACYIFLGFIVGWWYSLSTFLLWVFVFAMQHFATRISKRIKELEGYIIDKRL